MNLHLGDNARDGLRFLLLGGGLLLLLRLVYTGLANWMSPPLSADLPVAISAFRNGYLLRDPMTLVVGGRDLPQRLAIAVMFTVISALVLVVFALVIAKLVSLPLARIALRVARVGLFVCGVWWIYVALALPPHTMGITQTTFVRTVRPALVGDLSLPWPATVTNMPRSSVQLVEHRSEPSTISECGWIEKAEAVEGEKRMELARVVPKGVDCALERAEARTRLVRLSELLVSEAR